MHVKSRSGFLKNPVDSPKQNLKSHDRRLTWSFCPDSFESLENSFYCLVAVCLVECCPFLAPFVGGSSDHNFPSLGKSFLRVASTSLPLLFSSPTTTCLMILFSLIFSPSLHQINTLKVHWNFHPNQQE